MYEEKRRMEIIADVLSEKLDLPVHLVEDGPSAAWYDGKALNLSRKQIKGMMDKMDDKCIKYLLYHESAHALLSDMATVNTLSEVGEGKKHISGMNETSAKVILGFTQALEDVRIEREISKKYDGVKHEIDQRLSDICKATSDTISEQLEEINPRSIGLAALLKYRKPEYYEKLVSKRLKQLMESKDVNAITDKINSAKSSWDVFEIAKELFVKTKKYLESLQPPPPCMSESLGQEGHGSGKGKKGPSKGDSKDGKDEKKSGGDSDGKGKDGDKDKEGKGNKSADGEKDKKENGSEGKGDGNGKPPESKQPGDVSNQLGDGSPEKIEDAAKELKEMVDEKRLQPSAPHVTTSLPEIPANWSPEFDIEETYPILDAAKEGDKVEIPKKKDRVTYDHLSGMLGSFTRILQRKVKDMFTLKTKSHYEAGHSSGKLISTKDLWKVSNASDKIFMKRYKEQNSDYAITVLIDQSGSMGGCGDYESSEGRYISKLQAAKESLIVLSETLDQLKIPFEVLGFSTHHGSYDTNYRMRSLPFEEQQKFRKMVGDEYREDHTYHMIYKEFDGRYDDDAKARIGAIHSHGNNWDGEAIMWAAKRLIAQKAREKILIVLSDGQPSGGHSSGKNCSFTRAVVRSVQKRVKTIGIGLQTESPKEFYKNWVYIKNPSELPNVFCRILFRVLNRRGS